MWKAMLHHCLSWNSTNRFHSKFNNSNVAVWYHHSEGHQCWKVPSQGPTTEPDFNWNREQQAVEQKIAAVLVVEITVAISDNLCCMTHKNQITNN